MHKLIPAEMIENKIYLIRGQKVILDYDLAELYKVETKYLKRQVRRNIQRFPSDFMFELTKKENLRCQNVTSSFPYGGRRYLSYAFTEPGVAMLSSVLGSEKAIQVNIAIIRAFIKLRKILATHKNLAHKVAELEKRVEKNEVETKSVFNAIRQLIAVEEKPKRRIGFLADREDE